jgi:hypothetical protein
MCKKPTEWPKDNSRCVMGMDELFDDYEKIYKKSKEFTDVQVYGNKISKSSSPVAMDFVKKMPDIFVLKTKFDTFLIATEGYDYARYVAVLI